MQRLEAGRVSRRGRSIVRAILVGSTVLASGLATPALAQSAPAYRNLDANGVDLTRGDHVLGLVEGSIGSDSGELSLVRDGVWISGYNGHRWDSIFLNEFSGLQSVVTGPTAEYFNGATSQQANGSTLTLAGGDYVYRTRDGTTTAFSKSDPNCSPTATQSCLWRPATITTPNGKTVDLGWEPWLTCPDVPVGEEVVCTIDSVRLNQVSNSYGYSIVFTYALQDSGGTSGPPLDWHRRTQANFYNSAAGSAAQGSVSYAYPATGVTQVTDMGGRVWRIAGSFDQISGIRRPGASADTTTISRSSGIVTSVTRDGVTTNYNRSVAGNTATMVVTNALSQQTTTVSDMTIGRPTSVTDALSRTTSFQYDGNGRLTRVTQPEGDYVQYTLDGRGNVTQTQSVAKPSSGLATITTSAAFDASCINPVTCNSPNSTTDAKGNVTEYSYDPTHGGLLSVKAPAPTSGAVRPETRYTYTLTNGEYQLTAISACQTLASCAGAADEVKTTVAYDTNNRITQVSKGSGDGSLTATTTVTYDGVGNMLTADGPLPATADTTRYRYNSARQVVGVVGPDPDGGGALKHRAQRVAYTNGLPTNVEIGTVNSQSDGDWAAFTAAETVTTAYDANARKGSDILSSAGTNYAATQYSYDALGRLDCTAQRMNPAIYGSLPAACSLGTQGSFGPDRISKTIYDAAGQVTKVQSAYGTADQSDEVTTAYTSNGQTQTVTDAEGNMTTYEYDGHDRLAKTRYPSATTDGVSSITDYIQPTYDANGNVTNLRLRDGQNIGYTFDNLNRMILMDRSNAGIDEDITYTYDLLGRMRTSQTPWGHLTHLSYDALGRKVSEITTYGYSKTSQYDAAGRRTRLTWGDGFYVDYDHDLTGNVTAIRENGATSGVGVLASYAYDNLGRRTSVTRGNGTVTSYSYDPVSRLAALTQDLAGTAHDISLGFSYNPASQITSNTRSNDAYAWGQHYNVDRPYGVNGLNQLTTAGSVSIGYDGRGNLTSSGSSSYTYGQLNQLVTFPGGTLYYDPLMRLDLIYGASAHTALDYDGANLSSEYNYDNAALLRRYVHGPGTDEPLVWYEGTGTGDKRWLHADERGSIVALTNASGAVININTYDEYGIPASTNLGRFQYTGQAWIPELGMYYYKARIYSPTLGRFMQTDPIGYDDGMNIYAYVAGDPVNYADPTGLCQLERRLSNTDVGGIHYWYFACGNSSGGGGGGGWGAVGSGGRLGSGDGGSSPGGGGQSSGGDNPAPPPQNNPCSQSGSLLSSARSVLETAATGADIATVGLAAGGVTGIVAVGTKIVGYGFEGTLGLVNAYDWYANGNWGPLAEQGASLGTRLIPGGRTLQGALKTVRGPTGALRTSAGQFRSSRLNNPAIEEAGNIALQKSAGGAVKVAVCGK